MDIPMQLLTGQTLSFTGEPGGGNDAWRHESAGALVIGDDGRIAWSGDRSSLPTEYRTLPTTDYGGSLILPGFVDAHLHFPQYRMIAAPGRDLLDWLQRFTFPEEQRYGDPAVAGAAAEKFLAELFNHGITACLAFSTIHPVALDALLSAAQARRMALISGKTMMDCNAPAGLSDTAQSSYDQSRALIAKWHGVDRLQYAISPRFALTSTEAQLEAAGALRREFPDFVLQTHLSENVAEIEAVAASFPWSRDYTDVYDRYGLLGEKCLFAHGIHLGERELARLSESASTIVHCPTSNNFLGSGLFRYRRARQGAHPVTVALGCDIGGGTDFSMLSTMRDAYVVSQLVGEPVSASELFYAATLGNARLLHLEHEIGSLDPGMMADLTILDPKATPLMAERHALSLDLHDMLFALMIMGDDRAVEACWVAGTQVKPRREPNQRMDMANGAARYAV
jgi:guanine deaminase